MSKIKQYDKGFSPPALQRKYSLTYVQGVELADYIQGLKELLKDCRFMLREMSDINNWFEGDDCEINYYMATECGKYVAKIDEALK